MDDLSKENDVKSDLCTEEDKKTTKAQIGIRTTSDIKEVFETQVEGDSNDEKIRLLMKLYEQFKNKESETEITSYIQSIEESFSSVTMQLLAIEKVVKEKDKRMKADYIDFIGKELYQIEKNIGDIDAVKKEKVALDMNLKRKELDLNTMNNRNKDISTELDENKEIINSLKSENSELLKKINMYMELSQQKDTEQENKIQDMTLKLLELEKTNTIQNITLSELEKDKISLKAEIEKEKTSYKNEIKEITKENRDEIRNLDITLNKKDSEIIDLKQKISELENKLVSMSSKNIEIVKEDK